ncbi:hypothetical protein D3C72_1438910 [compost metagenome]
MPGGNGDFGLLQPDLGNQRSLRLQGERLGIALIGLLQLLRLFVGRCLMVGQCGILKALFLGFGKCLERFRIALEQLQRHAAVELCRAQRLLECNGLFKILQRLFVVQVLQQIGTSVVERTPAPESIERCLHVHFLGRIRPSGIGVLEGEVALHRQARQADAHDACHGHHGFAREVQQHKRQQSGQQHGPDIAAVQHKWILQPGGDEFGAEQNHGAQQHQAHQAPAITAAQQQAQAADQQGQIASRSQPMGPTGVAQWIYRPQINRHPLHVGQ